MVTIFIKKKLLVYFLYVILPTTTSLVPVELLSSNISLIGFCDLRYFLLQTVRICPAVEENGAEPPEQRAGQGGRPAGTGAPRFPPHPG
jgi:hypothetical protein